MSETKVPKDSPAGVPVPCGCKAEVIGLSDGSSIHGWRCSSCGHKWPRQATVRGMARFKYVAEDLPAMQLALREASAKREV